METATVGQRFWIYFINELFYNLAGFGAALPFLLVLKLHIALYILIAVGISTLFAFLFSLLILGTSRGYTIGSAMLRVKYVSSDGGRLSSKQCLIRAVSESVLILVLFDLIYFAKNRTERGVIDRLSDSFGIDINL